MKEATGELNMTVITVVAIGAIALLFYNFIWPIIQLRIVDQTCSAYGEGYHASTSQCAGGVSVDGSGNATASQQDTSGGRVYYCCPPSN